MTGPRIRPVLTDLEDLMHGVVGQGGGLGIYGPRPCEDGWQTDAVPAKHPLRARIRPVRDSEGDGVALGRPASCADRRQPPFCAGLASGLSLRSTRGGRARREPRWSGEGGENASFN